MIRRLVFFFHGILHFYTRRRNPNRQKSNSSFNRENTKAKGLLRYGKQRCRRPDTTLVFEYLVRLVRPPSPGTDYRSRWGSSQSENGNIRRYRKTVGCDAGAIGASSNTVILQYIFGDSRRTADVLADFCVTTTIDKLCNEHIRQLRSLLYCTPTYELDVFDCIHMPSRLKGLSKREVHELVRYVEKVNSHLVNKKKLFIHYSISMITGRRVMAVDRRKWSQ